jgi:hypothetical protein
MRAAQVCGTSGLLDEYLSLFHSERLALDASSQCTAPITETCVAEAFAVVHIH